MNTLGRRVKQAVKTNSPLTTEPTYYVNAGAQEVVAITGDVTAFNDPTADPEDAGIAPYNAITGQGARGSLLADLTAKRYNVQPAASDTPDGWLAASGAIQATPALLGWTAAVTPIDRDHLGRPLYDTFAPVGTSTWKVPIPNGTHAVVIMCGDADSRAQTNNLLVNGVAVTDPTPYDGNVTLGYETGAFDGYAITVNVTAGFITIQSGTGALSAKLNFIEVGAVGTTADAATIARVQAAAVKATHDTAKPKAKTPPMVKRNVWGTYVDELISYTVAKPRHSAVRYYTASNSLYSIAATTNAAGAVVERYSYNAYGVRTAKNSAGATLVKSAVNQDRGFTSYKLDPETGLYYARARMYSAKLGRFIIKDPEGYIDGVNTFGAHFIPNAMDPTGTTTLLCGENIAISKLARLVKRGGYPVENKLMLRIALFEEADADVKKQLEGQCPDDCPEKTSIEILSRRSTGIETQVKYDRHEVWAVTYHFDYSAEVTARVKCNGWLKPITLPKCTEPTYPTDLPPGGYYR